MKRSPLVIVNGPLVQQEGRVMLNHHTGVFLKELSGLAGPLHLHQYLLQGSDAHGTGGLNAFDVNATPGLSAGGTVYHVTRPLRRRLDNLLQYARTWRAVAACPWLYVFLPGTLPAFAADIARRRGIPYGCYVRGIIDPDTPRMARLLAASRLVVCNNEHSAAELQGKAPRIAVARPMMLVTREDIPAERSFEERPSLRILYVGRLEEGKGIPEFFSALDSMAAAGARFELDLVGSGPLATPDRLPPGLRQRTRLHGFVSDKAELARHYHAADLFILPTRAEGFPRVLYEAMTYGLPIATTFVGGIPAVMRDGHNCLRLETGQAAQFAQVMTRLLSDRALRLRLSAAALATMREVHDRTTPSHAELVHKEMCP